MFIPPKHGNLRAAALAADPGRSGNESNQMGTNILRCFALSGFSSCCYEFWLPFPPAAAEAFATAAAGPRIGKHHSSQGRRSPKIAPRKCMKMPNVTSETHRKWWFWLLFPLAASMNMNFGYLFLLLLQKLLLLLLLVPGCENTMAVKDGEAPKSHPENAWKCLT